MVRQVNRQGVTIVLIEHVMRVIVGVCTRALVLNFGRLLTEGKPEAVLRDPRVIEAYLGERYARQDDAPSTPPPPQGEPPSSGSQDFQRGQGQGGGGTNG
jgi:branched-chain amino acid transport system ATP-binding protein